jgi:hypothetical protein
MAGLSLLLQDASRSAAAAMAAASGRTLTGSTGTRPGRRTTAWRRPRTRGWR